jgi:hypothetical protein
MDDLASGVDVDARCVTQEGADRLQVDFGIAGNEGVGELVGAKAGGQGVVATVERALEDAGRSALAAIGVEPTDADRDADALGPDLGVASLGAGEGDLRHGASGE